MIIAVERILPSDFPVLFPKILADVAFYEISEEVKDLRSATVRVYLDKREDISYSQLKEEAIEAAIDFIKLAISSRS